MARTSRSIGKNNWALFLLILLGIVVGSVLGYLVKDIKIMDVKVLKWLNQGLDFSIGDSKETSVVTLDLGALVINFGLRLRITIGSVIGAIASIFIYKKL